MRILQNSIQVFGMAICLGLAPLAIADQAKPVHFAKITGGTGDIYLDDEELDVGDEIMREGTLRTGADGSALVAFEGKDALLSLAPNTRIRLVRPDSTGKRAYVLEAGQCRWQVKKKESPRRWIQVRTRSAVMGVRGTDFLAISNPLLGESEVVVFAGQVEFQSADDPKDRKLVPPGHWGGIGGRFGKKTSALMKLPQNVLEALKKPVEVAQTED